MTRLERVAVGALLVQNLTVDLLLPDDSVLWASVGLAVALLSLGGLAAIVHRAHRRDHPRRP